MACAAIMVQGTGSNVGKSLLVTGLCRKFSRMGLRVRPFKPQNMSNNAAATPDGGEIGRAQALQARACLTEPTIHMNPVLLKPESETGAQLVVCGKRFATVKAKEYAGLKAQLVPTVLESFRRLASEADLVIVEGAGSPAEINLRNNDLANMGFARATRVPVVLVGDIDRGGVIAQIIGTKAVLDPADASCVRGFAINRFRGDPNLFTEGYRHIESITGWRGLGIVPWLDDARLLPAEDALDLPTRDPAGGDFKIACLGLSRIANFDDLDPLRMMAGTAVSFLRNGEPIPGDTDLLILPGSKSTLAELEFIRQNGWDIDILAHARRGGRILGICGGFQMLGHMVSDPEGIEGLPGLSRGLGLLDVTTVMTREKAVRQVCAFHTASGEAVEGYEIHIGRTDGNDCARPFACIRDGRFKKPDGAVSPDGRIAGTYLHGIFSNDSFRGAFLSGTGFAGQNLNYSDAVEDALDSIAGELGKCLDINALHSIARGYNPSRNGCRDLFA